MFDLALLSFDVILTLLMSLFIIVVVIISLHHFILPRPFREFKAFRWEKLDAPELKEVRRWQAESEFTEKARKPKRRLKKGKKP